MPPFKDFKGWFWVYLGLIEGNYLVLIQAVHSKVIQGLLRVIALGTLFYGFCFQFPWDFSVQFP